MTHASVAGTPLEVPDDLLRALATGDVGWLADCLTNDLQEPALDLRPDLQRTLDDGREAGARGTLLSGSGPTVLLLCEDQAHAQLVRLAMVDRGHEEALVAAAPVPGVHEVVYEQ
jgi:4-diphosphocytidyl-2-C-methyl-D-erythritol kinase